jgi:hypothetical protein
MQVSWSSAAVSCDSAWLSCRFADVGSRSARSWPALTCCPALTYTSWRVPLVLKLTVTSVPAAMLPVPVTVDWTTPGAAFTISVDVRAELVGGPISATASAATAIATTPRT